MSRKQRDQDSRESDLPRFATVAEEAAFWDTHSTSEFDGAFDEVTDVQFVVRRSTPQKTVTIRLPEEALLALSHEAKARGLPVSALTREWILERLRSFPPNTR